MTNNNRNIRRLLTYLWLSMVAGGVSVEWQCRQLEANTRHLMSQ